MDVRIFNRAIITYSVEEFREMMQTYMKTYKHSVFSEKCIVVTVPITKKDIFYTEELPITVYNTVLDTVELFGILVKDLVSWFADDIPTSANYSKCVILGYWYDDIYKFTVELTEEDTISFKVF